MIPVETQTSYWIVEEDKNRLLNYLPGIYADHPFLEGFLRIFDSLWLPLEHQIDQLYNYFDPAMTSADFLPWLGTWVDLILDENWPEARRRRLIENAADLYRRRGTAGALRDYIAIYAGAAPEIVEYDQPNDPFHFSVVLRAADPSAIDADRLRRIIEEEKPAHTSYTLRVEKQQG